MRKRNLYFEDPIDYLVWKYENTPANKRPTVRDGNFIPHAQYIYANNKDRVERDMLAENTKRKKERTQIAKEVGDKGGKVGGKISGQKNVESGHLDKIRTKESSSKGGKISGRKNAESGHISNLGKIQGRKNVESGHLARAAKIGGKAASKKNAETSAKIKKERYYQISPEIPNDWFKGKDIVDWFMQSSFPKEWGLTSGKFMYLLLRDENYFETKGSGRNKKFKKKNNI